MVGHIQPPKQLQPILESIHFISLLCQERWLPPFLSKLTWTMLFSINSHEREVVACSCCNNLEHNRQCRDTCELFHRKTSRQKVSRQACLCTEGTAGYGVLMSFQVSFIVLHCWWYCSSAVLSTLILHFKCHPLSCTFNITTLYLKNNTLPSFTLQQCWTIVHIKLSNAEYYRSHKVLDGRKSHLEVTG